MSADGVIFLAVIVIIAGILVKWQRDDEQKLKAKEQK